MTIRNALLGTAALLLLSTGAPARAAGPEDALPTKTPIKHLVVIFHENVSFDHYFATYPHATNPTGEPAFTALPGTPAANTLAAAGLLDKNPNTDPANGAGATLPFRLDRSQANTADQNHAYTAEQLAYNNERVNLFPKHVGKGSAGAAGPFGTAGQVMGYFDGNTVTAMWNYAQHYSMNDNAFTDTYGPSTPGMLEVVAGQTNGMKIVKASKPASTMKTVSYYVDDGQGGLTMINDVDPAADVCSSPKDQAMMTGPNIGDLLNQAGISWGSFMGGFDLSATNANGTTGCVRSTDSKVVGRRVTDYIPHHAWFQYFESTANKEHTRPASVASIGHSVLADGKTREPANHGYDLNDFTAAVRAGNFPAVSYIKMPAFQDGHAGYSDPLDEQEATVQLINLLQSLPEWQTTAVVITWDDSDGWYDHAYTKPTRGSFNAVDQLNGDGKCGEGTAPMGVNGKPVNGRCGPGTRIPFLMVSPWAKANHVDHTLITQASVVRFIEDNWLGGKRLGAGSFDAEGGALDGLFDFAGKGDRPKLVLDPVSGTPAKN